MVYNPNLPAGAAPDSAPDPYQSIIEAEQRQQEESDRNYKNQLQQLKNQKAQIAIQKGEAAANAWYQQQQVALAQQKMTEDKRQFDVTTAQANQQFQERQKELARQFDLTTAEGQRQFNLKSAEESRQFNLQFVNSQNEFQAKQAQYATSLGEQVREFDAQQAQQTAEMQEKARQFDLTRADGLDQFAKTFGLDEQKVKEQARQFDLSRADQVDQFAKNLAEQQRQFNVNASGYMDNGQNTLARDEYLTNATGYVGGAAGGQTTLAREQFQNQALYDWTKQAIDLASTPADWVKYKQYTSGVAGAAGEIPGLNWTQGGQVGNTAFAGNPEANSLQRVLGTMGVGSPDRSAPTGSLSNVALTPEQQAAMQSARPGGDSLYGSNGQGFGPVASGGFGSPTRSVPTGSLSNVALTPEQQAAMQAARPVGDSLYGANGQGFGPTRSVPTGSLSNVALTPEQQAAMQAARPVGDSLYGANGQGFGPAQAAGGGQAAGAATGQPVTNWAQQAAGMIKPLDVNTLSPAERQLYSTADQFSRNPQGAAAGWYENLDPNTKEMLRGAAQAQGHDWTTVMSRYNRSKWGGGAGAQAA